MNPGILFFMKVCISLFVEGTFRCKSVSCPLLLIRGVPASRISVGEASMGVRNFSVWPGNVEASDELEAGGGKEG